MTDHLTPEEARAETLSAKAAVRVLASEHHVGALHWFDIAEHRGTHCDICDALAILDRLAPPPLDVERLAAALRALRIGRRHWSYPVVGDEAEAAWLIEWLTGHHPDAALAPSQPEPEL